MRTLKQLQLESDRKSILKLNKPLAFLVWSASAATDDALVMLEDVMVWTTPMIEEMCIGMEVTAYESAEIEG